MLRGEDDASEEKIKKECTSWLAGRVRFGDGGSFYRPCDEAIVGARPLAGDIERAAYRNGFIFCTYNSEYETGARCHSCGNGLDPRRRVFDGQSG
jgi:hypothetical protein